MGKAEEANTRTRRKLKKRDKRKRVRDLMKARKLRQRNADVSG